MRGGNAQPSRAQRGGRGTARGRGAGGGGGAASGAVAPQQQPPPPSVTEEEEDARSFARKKTHNQNLLNKWSGFSRTAGEDGLIAFRQTETLSKAATDDIVALMCGPIQGVDVPVGAVTKSVDAFQSLLDEVAIDFEQMPQIGGFFSATLSKGTQPCTILGGDAGLVKLEKHMRCEMVAFVVGTSGKWADVKSLTVTVVGKREYRLPVGADAKLRKGFIVMAGSYVEMRLTLKDPNRTLEVSLGAIGIQGEPIKTGDDFDVRQPRARLSSEPTRLSRLSDCGAATDGTEAVQSEAIQTVPVEQKGTASRKRKPKAGRADPALVHNVLAGAESTTSTIDGVEATLEAIARIDEAHPAAARVSKNLHPPTQSVVEHTTAVGDVMIYKGPRDLGQDITGDWLEKDSHVTVVGEGADANTVRVIKVGREEKTWEVLRRDLQVPEKVSADRAAAEKAASEKAAADRAAAAEKATADRAAASEKAAAEKVAAAAEKAAAEKAAADRAAAEKTASEKAASEKAAAEKAASEKAAAEKATADRAAAAEKAAADKAASEKAAAEKAAAETAASEKAAADRAAAGKAAAEKAVAEKATDKAASVKAAAEKAASGDGVAVASADVEAVADWFFSDHDSNTSATVAMDKTARGTVMPPGTAMPPGTEMPPPLMPPQAMRPMHAQMAAYLMPAPPSFPTAQQGLGGVDGSSSEFGIDEQHLFGTPVALLGCLKLACYDDAFEENGYDDVEDLLNMNTDDINELLQTVSMKVGHRSRFIRGLSEARSARARAARRDAEATAAAGSTQPKVSRYPGRDDRGVTGTSGDVPIINEEGVMSERSRLDQLLTNVSDIHVPRHVSRSGENPDANHVVERENLHTRFLNEAVESGLMDDIDVGTFDADADPEHVVLAEGAIKATIDKGVENMVASSRKEGEEQGEDDEPEVWVEPDDVKVMEIDAGLLDGVVEEGMLVQNQGAAAFKGGAKHIESASHLPRRLDELKMLQAGDRGLNAIIHEGQKLPFAHARILIAEVNEVQSRWSARSGVGGNSGTRHRTVEHTCPFSVRAIKVPQAAPNAEVSSPAGEPSVSKGKDKKASGMAIAERLGQLSCNGFVRCPFHVRISKAFGARGAKRVGSIAFNLEGDVVENTVTGSGLEDETASLSSKVSDSSAVMPNVLAGISRKRAKSAVADLPITQWRRNSAEGLDDNTGDFETAVVEKAVLVHECNPWGLTRVGDSLLDLDGQRRIRPKRSAYSERDLQAILRPQVKRGMVSSTSQAVTELSHYLSIANRGERAMTWLKDVASKLMHGLKSERTMELSMSPVMAQCYAKELARLGHYAEVHIHSAEVWHAGERRKAIAAHNAQQRHLGSKQDFDEKAFLSVYPKPGADALQTAG